MAVALPAAPNAAPPARRHFRVLIVGGGTAGITVANLLLRQHPGLDLAILEPSTVHWYQPGWTLVGGGVMKVEQTRRQESGLIPRGASWIQAAATGFDPERNTVSTSTGSKLTYDALVVAAGLQCRWEWIDGLQEALGHDGVCSNYSMRWAPYTWETIHRFEGGTAVFTVPDTPIKCGGAPMKVMAMAHDRFLQRSGVGVNTRVILCTALRSLFSVPAYARVLATMMRRRGIEVRFGWNLRAVRGGERVAVFDVTDEHGSTSQRELAFDMLHAVPPMSAPEVVATSPLAVAGPGGWVEVDALTTQHRRFPNVFALGDVAGLPTSKTAGAVRAEAPVTAANVLSFLDHRALEADYDGYTVCPLITGYDRVVMAEFDYTKKPDSSFLIDPTKERWSMWMVKTKLLPWLYWNRMLPGLPHEGRYLRPLAPLARALGLAYRETPGDEAMPAPGKDGDGCA
jgi:sulfide:quinone oxidoreductase